MTAVDGEANRLEHPRERLLLRGNLPRMMRGAFVQIDVRMERENGAGERCKEHQGHQGEADGTQPPEPRSGGTTAHAHIRETHRLLEGEANRFLGMPRAFHGNDRSGARRYVELALGLELVAPSGRKRALRAIGPMT